MGREERSRGLGEGPAAGAQGLGVPPARQRLAAAAVAPVHDGLVEVGLRVRRALAEDLRQGGVLPRPAVQDEAGHRGVLEIVQGRGHPTARRGHRRLRGHGQGDERRVGAPRRREQGRGRRPQQEHGGDEGEEPDHVAAGTRGAVVPVPGRRRDDHHQGEHGDQTRVPALARPQRDQRHGQEQQHGEGRVAHQAEVEVEQKAGRLGRGEGMEARRLVGGEVGRRELPEEEGGRGQDGKGRRRPREEPPAARFRGTGPPTPHGEQQGEQREGRVLDGRERRAQDGHRMRPAHRGDQRQRGHREGQHLGMRPEQEAQGGRGREQGRGPAAGPGGGGRHEQHARDGRPEEDGVGERAGPKLVRPHPTQRPSKSLPRASSTRRAIEEAATRRRRASTSPARRAGLPCAVQDSAMRRYSGASPNGRGGRRTAAATSVVAARAARTPSAVREATPPPSVRRRRP